MKDGALTRLELLPIECGKRDGGDDTGLPRVASSPEIFERLAKISAPYGTKMTLEGGVIVCKWK